MAIKKPKKKVVDASQVEHQEVDLPEAGYQRREELARRNDELAEAAETLASEQGRFAIDPEKLAPDPDVIGSLDSLYVSNKQDGYVYCWEWTGNNGRGITMKQLRGWAPVQGDDPEAVELREGGSGLRKLADTILMRISKERHEALEAVEARKREERQNAPAAAFEEAGGRLSAHGIHTLGTKDVAARGAAANRNFVAQGVAEAAFENQIRTGTVPGAEIRDR